MIRVKNWLFARTCVKSGFREILRGKYNFRQGKSKQLQVLRSYHVLLCLLLPEIRE